MSHSNSMQIGLSKAGFYAGLNPFVTLASKAIIALIVLYAVVFPEAAVGTLSDLNGLLLKTFNTYYIYAVALFLMFCFGLALSRFGKVRLGRDDESPEFSFFSWFAMMFSAGMGIGLMFYSIGEPLYHFQSNPALIQSGQEGGTAAAVPSAMRYTLLHWGLHAWAVYVSAGLCMAYFAFRKGLPLTIRSTLHPLFGDKLNGPLGHVIDILAVVATTLGVATTMGAGVTQLVAGVEFIANTGVLLDAEGAPTATALIITLLLVMLLSTVSALTGVTRGVKWLSQVNIYLSIGLLAFFMLAGSSLYSAALFGTSVMDYTLNLIPLTFSVWDSSTELGAWQTGWTILYWAWWIAFAPFVGLFLARISRGRTIREFIVGCILVPSLICFVWMSFLGGTGLDLELNGQAGGAIAQAASDNIASVLFVTIDLLDSGVVAQVVKMASILLIITYLVTSADSGVLVLNTIMAGGNSDALAKHRVIWGVILTLMVGSLLLAGGLGAIQKAMMIGALPFSLVMILMCVSMLKSLLQTERGNQPVAQPA
ncbi:BCCT family transporter [Marinobacterium stanieri]|uniref:Choline/carnitine/betaine transport n=1 Tax=Marinobacterium stanieri TaxID=49186 RepID=A0A1N6TER4_9GAMM|nr:BCCT family transporter [Marinobacterium stanieri]SIQ51825.1 choline/carnitine/betaine transport [Marinobacterium stanieri]